MPKAKGTRGQIVESKAWVPLADIKDYAGALRLMANSLHSDARDPVAKLAVLIEDTCDSASRPAPTILHGSSGVGSRARSR